MFSLSERIMSIDPGSDTLGVSLFEHQKCSTPIVSYSHTHKASSIIRWERYESDVLEYGELHARLKAQYDNLKRLIKMLTPDVIVCESPFVNPRNPKSAATLMYVKQMLIDLSMDEEVRLPIKWIAPQQMKKAIGATMLKGKSSKEPVKEAITKLHEEGKFILDKEVSLHKLDEHSIDSIGVGYTYILNQLS